MTTSSLLLRRLVAFTASHWPTSSPDTSSTLFSSELRSEFFDGSRKILEGLAIYTDLEGSSIQKLSYNLGYTRGNLELLQEVRLLTKYVAKLTSVSYVMLTLAPQYTGDPREWKDMCVYTTQHYPRSVV